MLLLSCQLEVCVCVRERERERERGTERDREIERQRERESERDMEREREREMTSSADVHAGIKTWNAISVEAEKSEPELRRLRVSHTADFEGVLKITRK